MFDNSIMYVPNEINIIRKNILNIIETLTEQKIVRLFISWRKMKLPLLVGKSFSRMLFVVISEVHAFKEFFKIVL